MFTKNSFTLVENDMAESMYMRLFEKMILEKTDEAWERKAYYAGIMIGEAVCSKLEAEIVEGRDPSSITLQDIIDLRDEYYKITPFADNKPTIYMANTVLGFWKWGWTYYLGLAEEYKNREEESKYYREIGENYKEKIVDEWSTWGMLK